MNKKIIIFAILLVLWMVFIFFMSNTNGEDSGKNSSDIVKFIIDKYDLLTHASSDTIKYHASEEFLSRANYIFRKICHFGEYFILCILSFNFIISLNKLKILWCSLLSVAFSFIYACLDEYHQTFINGRGGSFTDVLIDFSGAIIGCLLCYFIFKLHKKNINMTKNVAN